MVTKEIGSRLSLQIVLVGSEYIAKKIVSLGKWIGVGTGAVIRRSWGFVFGVVDHLFNVVHEFGVRSWQVPQEFPRGMLQLPLGESNQPVEMFHDCVHTVLP